MNLNLVTLVWGSPGGSDGKESACIVGDPGLVPGLERSPGEKGIATHSITGIGGGKRKRGQKNGFITSPRK